YPGGNPHSALDIALLHPNVAIAYGVNAAHPGFGSTGDLMSALIGHAGDTNRTPGNPSLIYLGDCTPDFAGNCDGGANDGISPIGSSYNFGGDGDNYFPNIPIEALTVTRVAGDFTGAKTSGAGDPDGDHVYSSSIVVGTAVLISALAVDLNTHIEVGPPTDWSVQLPAGLLVPIFGGITHVDLATYRALYLGGLVARTIDLPVQLVNPGDAQITATYDASTNEIKLVNVKASSGSGIVRIKGQLFDTNDLGNIQVNGGLGHVEIQNQTSVALNVADIYAGTLASADASTAIVDLLDTNTGIQTMYTFRPGAGINVYTGSLNASMDDLKAAGPANHINGNETTFTPQSGLRLEWSLQATLNRTLDTSTSHWHANNWIFDTPNDPNNPWLFYQYTGDHAGTYFDANLPDSHLILRPGDTNQFEETITGTLGGSHTIGICYNNVDGYNDNTDNQHCAQDPDRDPDDGVSLHGYRFYTTATLTLTISVRADNPVGIKFAGHDRGLIDIQSNANVFLGGTLTNPNGDTNITVTNGGSVLLPTSQSPLFLVLAALFGASTAADQQAAINTNNLTISAAGSVGTSSAPITATLTSGGVLNSTSGAAGTHLALSSGALIGNVHAGSTGNWGDITISATGSLLRFGGGTNVEGRDITLTTSIGSIGTLGTKLRISAHATSLANGGFSHGFVTAEAENDIGLQQVGGDLVVSSIDSHSGDVSVDVTAGGIYDARSMTPAQLLSESDAGVLWARLRLTVALGANDLTAVTVGAFEGQYNQAYRQYWDLRKNATDYDIHGVPTTGHYTLDTLTLTTQGIANLRPAASSALGHIATDAEVQAYAQGLYTADVTFFDGQSCDTAGLHCRANGNDTTWRSAATFDTPPASYNASFAFHVSGTQNTDLTKNAVWTETELKYFVNRTALEPAVGTPVPPTQPNINGGHVILHAFGSVGRLAAPIDISLTDMQNGTLTDEQAAALALAAAPGDVTFVGTDIFSNPVEFSFTGSHSPPFGVTLTGIRVKQLAPLFVNATGTFDATSDHGAVFVQSTESDLRIGFVSAATDASLIAPQNIRSAGTSAIQIHTGHDLTLLAGAGDIAASHVSFFHSPLVIQVGGTLMSAGAGHLLDLQEATGDLRFQRIASGDNSYLDVPHGSLLQVVDGTGIGAANLIITVQNNVGTALQFVTILLPAPAGRLFTDAGGNVWIDSATGTVNPDGNLNVSHVFSSGGNVTLHADGSILNPDAVSSASVHGNTLNFATLHGSVGVVGGDLLVDSAFSGAGVVNATVAGGDIYLIETLGNLSLGTDTVDPAGGPHTAHFVTQTGDIRNGLVSGVNVTAPKLWLGSSAAIGTVSKSVTTAVGDVNGRASGGSMYIDQFGAVRIGHVLDNHDATPPQGLFASADIVFTAHSPITIDEDVVAGGTITITSVDSGVDDLITVSPGVTVHALGGSVNILSGDGIWQKSGSTIQSPTEIYLEVDHASTDPGVGGTAQLDGTLIAPLIVVSGNGDQDTLTLHPDLVVGHVQMLGGGAEDLLTVDLMPTLDLAHKLNGGSGPGALNTGTPFGARNTVDLDGQAAADHYVINTTGSSDYIVNVHDTGAAGDGADVLTINGTAAGDVFLLRANFVARLVDTTSTDPNTFVERINYDRTVNVLQVNGAAGNDEFYADDNSALTTLDGGIGTDTFQFGQMFGAARTSPDRVAPGDEVETVLTTVGYLSRGVSFSTTAYGGDNNDTFTVYSNKALLKLFGEDGNDTFIIRAFLIAGTTLLATSDTLANGGLGDDHFEYNINAPVSIDGGNGVDTVVVIGTEQNDNFVIQKDGIMGAGLNVKYVNVEKVEVDGLEGDDNFYVLSTDPGVVTTIIGGAGSDTINVGGDVTGEIIALSVEGQTGYINHALSSADPDFNAIFAPGIQLHVANGNIGTVVVTPTTGQIVEDGTGGADSTSYTVRLAVPQESPGDVAYLTLNGVLDPSKFIALGGGAVLLSLDNIHFFANLVLTFDSSNWTTPQTIYVKAVSDSAQEGPLTAVIQSSIQSSNPHFDRLPIANVEITVIDDDKAGLIVSKSGAKTVEGGATDGYTIALTRAPDADVTITLAYDHTQIHASSDTLTFTSANWFTAQTVTVNAVDDATRENELFTKITHTVSSVGAVYTGVTNQQSVLVDVIDNDTGGLIVTESGGTTLVALGPPAINDTYTIQLTKAPTAPVTVTFLSDGKTLVSGGPDADGRSITIGPDGKPQMTFTAANWNHAFTVNVAANPASPPGGGGQPVQVFPAQPHVVQNIFGPLIVEGGQIEDRALRQGIRLPTETDAPLPVLEIHVDETVTNDTLNVFNDGSVSADTGRLGLVTSDSEAAALAAIYGVLPAAIDRPSFGQITGLNMGTGLALDFGDVGAPDVRTFDGGIAYHGIEVVHTLLGRNDDTFTVNGTVAGSITVVEGGGGNDHLIANAGGGAGSPLILFGDASQDGHSYDTTTGHITGRGREFPSAGNDTIDARNDASSVAIYGGGGNDVIWGSQAGDHIAGGSGNDEIHAQGGDDHIYGDDGFNVDLSKRLSLSTQILLLVNSAAGTDDATTHDALAAGQDTISGDGGNDVAFGDHGVINQLPGTNRILTTGSIVTIRTVLEALGANDTVSGNDGEDVLIGGFGNDMVDGGAGRDLIFGDNVSLTRASSTGDFTSPRFRVLQGGQIYSTAEANAGDALVTAAWQNDPTGHAVWGDLRITLSTAGNGDDYIAGGAGDDTIFGQLGNDVIQGDGSISILPAVQLPASCAHGSVGAANADFRSLAGACRDSSNVLWLNASTDNFATDGNDYIEGNGGNDVVFGNQGQDDIVGGNSDLFSLATPAQRADGSDLLFGGSGTLSDRNCTGDTACAAATTTAQHAKDADAIVGDNGDIFRLVGSGAYLQFAYDQSSPYEDRGTLRIVPRAVRLLDYTAGGPDYAGQAGPLVSGNIGASDEIHGEAGDDSIYGGAGNDVLYGDGQDDSIIGGYGNDWISGGAGDDGILGDDGRIFTMRVGTAEPLYGLGPLPDATHALSAEISIQGGAQDVVVNPAGRLTYVADLTPDNLDPNHGAPNTLFVPKFANDVIYGGLGNDSIHGGAGDDALTGAEAPTTGYTNQYDATGAIVAGGADQRSDWYHPNNPGNVLGFIPDTGAKKDAFGYQALYDPNDPLRKIMLTATGTLDKTGGGLNWLLNFDQTEGPVDAFWAASGGVATDGDDRIFGDLGNDWAVGGTGRDTLWGGWGND
ncbi:MAG: hypothetical protein QOE91_1351, partial [Gaiellaceae bacterium]|nr:hypothetical protein [Gaiellaceae bacterium]